MKINKIIYLTFVLLILNSCATHLPMPKNYFENNKKVGVLYLIKPIDTFREGPQGILDMAITVGAKYKEPLSIIKDEVNPESQMKDLYSDIFKSKGKPLEEINLGYDLKKRKEFKKPFKSKKKYFKYDLRYLKDRGIDELLVVKVGHGIIVRYNGFLETGRRGICEVETEIIDLSDNSLVFTDSFISLENLEGDWNTPPKYENLSKSISSAIKYAVEIGRTRF